MPRGRKKKEKSEIETALPVKAEIEILDSEDLAVPKIPVEEKPKIALIEQLFGNGDLNVVAAKLNEVIRKLNE